MANNTSCRINTIEMYALWRSGGFGGSPAHLNMKLRKRKVFRITHSVEFKQRSMKFAYPIPSSFTFCHKCLGDCLLSGNKLCIEVPQPWASQTLLDFIPEQSYYFAISLGFPIFWLFDSLFEPFDSKFAELATTLGLPFIYSFYCTTILNAICQKL